MNWTHSKFDCNFSKYTSGDYEIVQDYEGDGWQLNKAGYYVSSHSALKDAKESAVEHDQFS